MKFDDVLTQIGEFGKYQIICFLIATYHGFMLGFGVTMLPVFILATPDHRCAIPGINDSWAIQNEDHALLINETIPLESKCTFYDSLKNGTEQECTRWVYDDEIFNPSAIMEFDIVCSRKILRASTNMVYFMGLLVGGLVGGRISDRYGRRVTMYASVFPLIFASIGMAFSPNIFVVMACRFIQSTFIMSYYAADIVLFIEITGKSRRQAVVPLSDALFTLGYVLMTLPAYYLRNWRYLTFTVGIFQLPLAGMWWFIPESPRWLIKHNRRMEANKVVQYAARINGRQIPRDIMDSVEVDVSEQEGSFRELFKYKATCTRLLILGINWGAAATVYYGLSLNAGNLSGNIFINFVLSAAIDLPAALFILFAPLKFGRKKTHVFSFLVGGIACLATILVVLVGNNATLAFQILSTIGKFGASAGFGSVYLYTAELHPTSMRSLSIGFCSMCARIASLCAPFVADLGSYIPGRFSKALPLIVFGSFCVLAGLLSLILPETHKRPLPETVQEARDFNKRVKDDKDTKL